MAACTAKNDSRFHSGHLSLFPFDARAGKNSARGREAHYTLAFTRRLAAFGKSKFAFNAFRRERCACVWVCTVSFSFFRPRFFLVPLVYPRITVYLWRLTFFLTSIRRWCCVVVTQRFILSASANPICIVCIKKKWTLILIKIFAADFKKRNAEKLE